MAKLASTKVQGFWFFSIAITIGLYLGNVSDGVYVAGMSFLMGIFSAANVIQKKVLNEQRD